MQLLQWEHLHHVEVMRVHDPRAGLQEFQSGASGELRMEPLSAIFDITTAGGDDLGRANAVVQCPQAAAMSATHEIDDLALLAGEMTGDGKNSPDVSFDVSFVEFMVETEIHQHGFAGLHCPVQEMIIVELLEDSPARNRAGLEYWPHGNPVRAGSQCCFDGSAFNLAVSASGSDRGHRRAETCIGIRGAFFMSAISAGLLSARKFCSMGDASAIGASGHLILIAADQRR